MTHEVANQQINTQVIEDLRAHALAGAKIKALIEIIRRRLALAPDAVLVLLRYLSKAFDVHLNTILPLRELVDLDDDAQEYLRALRICFWFSACIRKNAPAVDAWNPKTFPRSFASKTLENWGGTSGHEIEGCFPNQVPDLAYVRGKWETEIYKNGVQGPSDGEILASIRGFAAQWGQSLRTVGGTDKSHYQHEFWFQIQDNGPRYVVVACVEAIVDHLTPTQRQVHLSLM